MRKGDISWLLHPEQAKLLNWLEARRRELAVIVISRQWGKSFMLLAYCIAHCLANPKHTVLFLAPHLSQLQTIVLARINTIMQWLPEDCVPYRRENVWAFPNGSILRLDGVIQRGVRLRGDAVHLCVIDECRDIAALEEIIASHITPMFTTTEGRCVLISSPPDSPAHSFTAKYIKDAIEQDNLYTATYKQNPLLSTSRLRYLIGTMYPGGETHPTFRREYMADYSTSDPTKRVVREWDEKANDQFFETYIGAPQNLVRPYIGMDFGHADPCGIIGGWYDPMAGCLVVTQEHFEARMNTTDVGQKLMGIEAALRAAVPKGSPDPIRIMDIDPALMSDMHQMFGLRFEPANKTPGSRLAMHNRLRVAIAEGKVRIHPNCVQTRYQLRTGVFNAKGSDYLRTERTGHLDLIDALKYLVANLRWNELLYEAGGDQQVGPGQVYIGPFRGPQGGFRSNMVRRPV